MSFALIAASASRPELFLIYRSQIVRRSLRSFIGRDSVLAAKIAMGDCKISEKWLFLYVLWLCAAGPASSPSGIGKMDHFSCTVFAKRNE